MKTPARKTARYANQQELDRLAMALMAADPELTIGLAYMLAMDEMEAREKAKAAVLPA